MGANYSFEFISIVHCVLRFFMYNKSTLGQISVISFFNGMHVFLQCGPCQTTMLPTVLEFSAIKYVLSVDKPNEFYDLEVIF